MNEGINDNLFNGVPQSLGKMVSGRFDDIGVPIDFSHDIERSKRARAIFKRFLKGKSVMLWNRNTGELIFEDVKTGGKP